ncbi:hypothetical protein ACJJIP_08545 [Microbulbifer sp. VTAC004]|uniref:hypothetical protein n=1 Tax=Microbulbifer sp. VTAC004 TaxID=3243386 RepID=UPI00403976DF
MNYDTKLGNLNSRRSLPQLLQKAHALDGGVPQSIQESYSILNESSVIKYVLGSMQPVNQRYTEICFEEGDRVASSLKQSLKQNGINSFHEFQGSVPLDIHIKGASDVDVLLIHSYLTWERPTASHKSYTPSSEGISMITRMHELRIQSERILKSNFPAVYVDVTGAKSIAMEGGSLQRKIDIVPSHWHDTLDYQHSNEIKDREVRIYNKDKRETFGNWPFKHIHQINQRDRIYSGNLKKVCRLLKNIKADASSSRVKFLKNLSSYDIASLAYHMDRHLSMPSYYDLGLLGRVNDFMIEICSNDCELGKQFLTPDGSRLILDNMERQAGAMALTLEINSVYKDLLQDIAPGLNESVGRKHLDTRPVYI